jgi:DNA invertase Pin-like site-specific DNA recombinase
MSKIFGYIRVSTADQGKKFSPGSQKDAITFHAKQKGDKIDEFLEDHETATTINRKKFQEICKRVQAGEASKVYVNFVDRFARNTEDTLRTVREFAEHGAQVFFVDLPGIDLATPEGIFMLTNFAAFSSLEHAKIRQRSLQGREKKMREGQPDCWGLGRGFRTRNGYPELTPDIEMVRQLFEWRDQGHSVYEIAGLFHEQGVRPLRAEFFRASTLTVMLANHAYIGSYRRCGKTFEVRDKNGELLAPIDAALFYRVQAKMKAVKRRKQGRRSRLYLLSQMLWCPDPCDGRFIGNATQSRGKHYRYYRCGRSADRENPAIPRSCPRKRISADAIEDAVWRAIWDLLTDPARLRNLAEALAREERRRLEASKRGDPREDLRKARERESKIQDMTEKEIYTVQQGADKIKALRLKIAHLEVEARAYSKVVDIAPLDVAEEACRQVASGPEPEGIEDRREVLDGLVDLRVEVGDGVARITGRVPVGAASAQKISSNCTNRLAGTYSSFEPIPFEISVRFAA